ncbi:fibronectin type III domain-containing protein [Flavisolibacter sp. BT320]|nr:fibronectin type III domain-containing protein [Flavisolibacter longurius]
MSVNNVTSNSATVTWTAATDPENEAVTYAVELNAQSSATGLTATTLNLTNLAKNTLYNGKITATDVSGNTTVSNFTFNTSDSPAPSDFTVKLDASTNKSLTVSWTAATHPTEAITYDIYNGATLTSANQTQTVYTFVGLTPQTSYALKVVAKSAGGKSTEKTLNTQTTANTAPVAFAAEELEHGFSYIRLKWTASTDANGDSLSYFLNRNGNLTPLTEAAVNGRYTYVLKGLHPSTAYATSIVAKDPFGGEVSSNAVQTTTNNGPENNFSFTINNAAEVEWIQPYTGQFNPSASTYSIDGVDKSLAAVQVNFLNLDNGKMYVKLFLNTQDFPVGENKQVRFKLSWGANESQTLSAAVSYTRYQFSATTAEISSAVIKRNSNGSYSFQLNFKNDIISDHTEWTVSEVKFDNSIQPGTISLQFPSGKTVQSVFGSLTEADYNYLKTKSDGFIIIKDAGGYHRLNFTYTVQ